MSHLRVMFEGLGFQRKLHMLASILVITFLLLHGPTCEISRPSSLPTRAAFRDSEEGRLFSQARTSLHFDVVKIHLVFSVKNARKVVQLLDEKAGIPR